MNDQQKIAIGQEADRLLKDSLFNSIIKTVLANAIQELVAAPVGDLTAQAAHARMKALEEIKSELRVLVNDGIVAKRNYKGEDQ